jgi:hypothetical protein
VRHCIVAPLSYQSHAVSTAVVGHLLDDLDLMDHFKSLRTFFLFASGDWARSFADELAVAYATADERRRHGAASLPLIEGGEHAVKAVLAGCVLQTALASSGLYANPVSRSVSIQCGPNPFLGAVL